jgi:acyl-CoA thioester hydrolase
MSNNFKFKQRVPFHDLDPLQIVWHGNYIKYFDMARFGLFKQAGLDLYEYFVKQMIVFPVTRFSTKHIVPLRYDDEFVCKATVLEAVYKIGISFEIRLVQNGQLCTKGTSEQVAVKMPEMEMQFEIPFEITSALGFA